MIQETPEKDYCCLVVIATDPETSCVPFSFPREHSD